MGGAGVVLGFAGSVGAQWASNPALNLAVGDRPFKRKCLKRMKEIRESGITMFYVSHSAGSVKRMCDRAIVLEKGRVGFDGDVEEAIKFLHYDGDDDEPDSEESSEDERDDALASDI